MTLTLTEEQASELWMILSMRIDRLNHEINNHRIDEVRDIASRQLARTVPMFKALNEYVTATA